MSLKFRQYDFIILKRLNLKGYTHKYRKLEYSVLYRSVNRFRFELQLELEPV